MCAHEPGLCTSTIPAIVMPRKTSSETRRLDAKGPEASGDDDALFVSSSEPDIGIGALIIPFRNHESIQDHPLQEGLRDLDYLILLTFPELFHCSDWRELNSDFEVRTV